MVSISLLSVLVLLQLGVAEGGAIEYTMSDFSDAASPTDEKHFTEADAEVAKGNCKVSRMNARCHCNHKSFRKGYQCSECFDNKKWGYGCDMDCPAHCIDGCDMSGDCIMWDTCPTNCKRNVRTEDILEKFADEGDCINERGECEACLPGYYGLKCKEACPEHCAPSKIEGSCTRGGKCYSCQEGWYGPTCSEQCPKACPVCAMKEWMNGDELMPAGSCTQPCPGDFHGANCDLACSATCADMGEHKSNCARGDGKCKACQQGYWGNFCTQECSGNCKEPYCNQKDGTCSAACKDGFWDEDCSKVCPDHSVGGCDPKTGFPKACDDGWFPVLEESGGICKACPSTCAGGKCSADGKCLDGCKDGYYGETCAEDCPGPCDGGCDQTSGKCKACPVGLTGRYCHAKCHKSCGHCSIHGHKHLTELGGATPPGDSENDCLSCPATQPSTLLKLEGNKGKCDCFKGAKRTDDGECQCADPEDAMMEAFFDEEHRTCISKCRNDKNGELTLAVRNQDGVTKCFRRALFNAVVKIYYGNGESLPGKGTDGCAADEYPIVADGDAKSTCIREDFAHAITV